ncbi:MAG: sensor histidine kinase [Pseudonocardia sp.]
MVRATLLRLAGVSVLAAVLLSALVAVGVWRIGEAEGERTAQRVSRQVAAAVLVPLAERDFTDPARIDRAALLTDLAPFLDSGMIHRIKVWAVLGDEALVVYSDEQRYESLSRPFDPELARRLDAGEVVVFPVPDDEGHRYEAEHAEGLREVFIGFRDSAGNPARLEVYVPVDVDGTVRYAMVVLLPLALLGVALLAVAMLPLAVALGRRIDRDRREREDALHYGLAAAELARRELAHELHDGVIPGLASAGLLLDAAATVEPERSTTLVADARGRIRDDIRRLRALLSELTSPYAAPDEAFGRLVAGLQGGPRIDLEIDREITDGPQLGDRTVTLLHRVAGELLRNAVTHAGAEHVRVRIGAQDGLVHALVADDGAGFDPDAPARPGHIGLLLVRRAVEDAGGTLVIRSAPGEGTEVAITLPAVAARPARPIGPVGAEAVRPAGGSGR